MAKQEFITGLDMGSGRVTCLIGTPDEAGRVKVLGGATELCAGIDGGIVVNIRETAQAVTRCIERAEAEAKATVTGVFLGVRGTHLESLNSRGVFNIARDDKEVTADDVQRVISNAKAVAVAPDREILHVVSQGFALDGKRGVADPIGMEGSLLEVEVHLVLCSTTRLNNVIKAVTQAGFTVIEPVYGLLAAGGQLVTSEEKALGSLLIDFGGQSISLGGYSEGSIRYSKELAVGADLVTRDLAFKLGTSLVTAERLKIAHGIAHPSLLTGDEEIEYTRVDGRTPASTKASVMMAVTLPRVEEILSIILDDLKESSFMDVIGPGGVILTGGGSLMRGTVQAAEQVLGTTVRVGMAHPDQIVAEAKWLEPAYATALGLLKYSSQPHRGTGNNRSTGRKVPVLLRKVIAFFEELF
ncbi:MAG: cell division protein FtsA [Elusimicrobiota bacterium]